MDLTDLLLAHFRETIERLHKGAGAHGKQIGVPPRYLVVTQREPSEHVLFNVGTAIRLWKIDAAEATEQLLTPAIPEPVRVGMYHDIGRGDFAVHDGGQRIRVGWAVRPRYGRGYDLPVERGTSGMLFLARRRLIF